MNTLYDPDVKEQSSPQKSQLTINRLKLNLMLLTTVVSRLHNVPESEFIFSRYMEKLSEGVACRR